MSIINRVKAIDLLQIFLFVISSPGPIFILPAAAAAEIFLPNLILSIRGPRGEFWLWLNTGHRAPETEPRFHTFLNQMLVSILAKRIFTFSSSNIWNWEWNKVEFLNKTDRQTPLGLIPPPSPLVQHPLPVCCNLDIIYLHTINPHIVIKCP